MNKRRKNIIFLRPLYYPASKTAMHQGCAFTYLNSKITLIKRAYGMYGMIYYRELAGIQQKHY
jgi:hypothetical protein